MILGSCACGKVTYEADQLDGPVVNAHLACPIAYLVALWRRVTPL